MFGNRDNIFGAPIVGYGEKKKEENIFESAGGDVLGSLASAQVKSQAMSCALAFIENGDYSAAALDASVVIVADMDGDGEVSVDEEEYYNELYQEVAYAFIALGADEANVTNFIDNADDEEGAKMGAFLTEKMAGQSDDDETIIANYATSGDDVMESFVKVIRGGRVVLKRKRIGRAHRMTAAQKVGLKAARRKAFTGIAKLHRQKSLRLRKKRGM